MGNKERQAAFKARMRAEGKKLIAVWVSPEQEQAIRAFLSGRPLPVTQAQPDRPRMVKVEPSRPERLSEYLVMRGETQLGRVWQVAEKPKWCGYPSGFNERQYSGATKKAVVERIERYKAL